MGGTYSQALIVLGGHETEHHLRDLFQQRVEERTVALQSGRVDLRLDVGLECLEHVLIR